MQSETCLILLLAPAREDADRVSRCLVEGFELAWAKSLDAGLEVLTEREVDALLVDHRLLQEIGPDRFFRTQAGLAEVPVLVLGPEGEESLAREAVRLGAQDYLTDEELDSRLLSRALHYAVERASVRRHLAEKDEHLRRVQRLDAVGRLAGGVAHDFNNMLSVMLGFTELAQSDLEADHPVQPHLKEVIAAGQRAGQLVSQLLAFSRRQVLRPVVVDLNEIVEDVARMLGRTLGEDIELRVRTDPELGRVEADPQQLQQVILSLAVHGREAMPGGGVLTIETANVVLDESYAESRPGVVAGSYAMLAVSDSSRGIAKENLSRVFEPFFGSRPDEPGSGLALATVYGIVKQSGGNVWAYSELGVGTTFKVYLPHHGDTGAVTESGAVVARLPRQGTLFRTVLLVEDEESVRRLVTEMLERQGYRVLVAADAEEALHIGERAGSQIGLLLTDVVMPGMNGRQLAERLAGRIPDLRVLFMSGYTDGAIAANGLLGKGVFFLSKPLSLSGLANKVEQCWEAEPFASHPESSSSLDSLG